MIRPKAILPSCSAKTLYRPIPLDLQAPSLHAPGMNQAKVVWTCDFFVQHTVGFRVLYVFVIMELASRKVIHFNVTEHPTLEWTKQQVRNACFEEQPKFLIHDNDGKFGQLGRPLRVERAGKRVSCRSALDAWLWRVMGIRLERRFRSRTEHPTQRLTSSG